MSIFFYIFLGSYLFNALPLKRIPLFKKERTSFIDFTQGFITLFAARVILNTQLALLVSTLGMMFGRLSPLFKENGSNKGAYSNSFPYLLIGALSVFSPKAFIVAFSAILILRHRLKDDNKALLWVFISLPFIIWYIERYDVYVIFSLIVSGTVVSQLVNRLEEGLTEDEFLPAEVIQLNKRNKRVSTRVLFIVILILATTLLFFNRYVYRGFGMQVDIIRHGSRDLKIVALTFDDGPDPKYTSQILDILKKYDVPATFFVVGKNAERHPEILKRMVEEGHSVGNHTYSHKSLIPLSRAKTYYEIIEADQVIKEIIGYKPVLFRPPRGLYTQYARKLLKREKYTIVLWDVSSRDWAEIRYKDIERNVLNNVKPGSIVLFHDSGNLVTNYGGDRHNTVRALPGIIEKLKQDGYIFLTVDDLILVSGLTATEGVEDD